MSDERKAGINMWMLHLIDSYRWSTTQGHHSLVNHNNLSVPIVAPVGVMDDSLCTIRPARSKHVYVKEQSRNVSVHLVGIKYEHTVR
jgi:hypothetical protein